MSAALGDLELRLDEVLAGAHFMDRAYRLRPRIGKAIRWDGPRDEVDLIQSFIADAKSREAEIHIALLIRTIAALERFVRKLSEETIEIRAILATDAKQIPDELKKRNIIASAKLLSTLDQPKDHISFDPQVVIANLGACEVHSGPFPLNAVAFSSFLQSPTVQGVERVLEGIGCKDIFYSVGKYSPLQQHLNTKGQAATTKRIVERLTDIVRWRNNAAHGGDNERALDVKELDSIIEFVRMLSRGLAEAVGQSISSVTIEADDR